MSIDRECTVIIDGESYAAYKGQSLLSLLVEHDIFICKRNLVTGEGRFGICGMGTCFECEVRVEGHGIRRACMMSIEADLVIATGDLHETAS